MTNHQIIMSSPLARFSFFSIDDPHIQSFIDQWVKTGDIQQATQKKSVKQQLHFLSARALLRALLFHLTHHRDWKIITNAKGKPYIINADGTAGPHISVSHTTGMVACAVSDAAPIGIDIEQWKVRDFIKLADHSFGPQENAMVKKGGIAGFYRIWTLREAMGKATGEGLSLVTNKNDLISSVVSNYHQSEHFSLYYHPDAPKNYSIAIALFHPSQAPHNGIMELINLQTLLKTT